MRRVIHLCFISITLLSSVQLMAQDRFAYAVTDLTKDGAGWNALRRLDLRTGEYSTMLLNGTDISLPVYDAATKKQLQLANDAKFGNLFHSPFATGVAAAAYDRKNNRLYYTPMFIDQLRYIDLKTMQVYYVTDESFTGAGNMHGDEGKCITRMVIAPDGNGYAITNDANTVIKFTTTGKKSKITQLGGLVDDPANGGVSVHNRCSSFGGDMIADDKGNLFIISARNMVFQVSVETKVAKYLGAIEGLPANFTVNGAVVDADENLLVSSAVSNHGYFVVNPKTWQASIYKSGEVFRSSDLANGNFLSTGTKKTTIETIARLELEYADLIQVYPNPVVNNQFTLQFNKVPKGDYTMELTDVMGRSVMQKRITLQNEFQSQLIHLESQSASGIYLVKLVDNSKKAVFEQKILIQ